jgi:hypothetical protein
MKYRIPRINSSILFKLYQELPNGENVSLEIGCFLQKNTGFTLFTDQFLFDLIVVGENE